MLSPDELAQLDAELCAVVKMEAALRLRLGQTLEALGRSGGHFELGFSSLSAYALERCERSVRWVEGARCLARRLENLPVLRGGVASGAVSWSMAEVVTRVATPGDEVDWLSVARSCTVREARELVRAALREMRKLEMQQPGRQGKPAASATVQAAAEDEDAEKDEDEHCTLTCTVDREELWLFEATRKLLGQLGVRGEQEQIEALLAEAESTLLGTVPRGAIDEEGFVWPSTAEDAWQAQRERWRVQAEVACEGRIRRSKGGAVAEKDGDADGGSGGDGLADAGARGEARVQSSAGVPVAEAARVESAVAAAAARGSGELDGLGSSVLDAEVRGLAQRLARQELELSSGIRRLLEADGWRRLGYATERQYARERLGMSRSSLLKRRSLASRLDRLPAVAAALGDGVLGVEAALQVVRVATAGTEAAWVERAKERTIKHLREEVEATQVAVRVSGERECLPPEDSDMAAVQEFERMVVRGGVASAASAASATAAHGAPRATTQTHGAWSVLSQSLAAWMESGYRVQMSAAPGVRSSGRVKLRFGLSRSTYGWWRGLEAQARRWLPRGMSWLSFVCLSLWKAWQHVLGQDVKYRHIYERDCFRCTSPVCNRRDVTPHHIQFRSAGGSDADDNVTSVCTWCHLSGIHGGRIRASGTAAHIDWELGPRAQPCVVVHGRRRAA